MLEIHNPASRDSSVFPQTPMITQESLSVNGDREESGVSSDITTGQNEDSHQSNFSWNDVGSASVDEGIGSDARSASPNDETDPLLLPDSTRVEAESVVTPAESSTGESLLQGFLSNKSEPISQPDSAMSPLPTVESLGLGSEYISIEHLGETAFCCGVCGEGYTERAGLDNHCTREGHFKCERTECGSVVCNTGEELVSHQQAAHPLEGSAEAPYVQQLAQQVQRIPVPPGLSSEQSRAPTSMYHAPSPTTITAQTTMYPITSYTNSPYPPQQAPGYQQQIHPRPFSNLVQQQPVKSPSPGSQRPGPQPQKRAAPSGGATSPTGKQRRMDFLVEDRNDDADCHVVAMQKRAENMPIISNVEGVRTPDSMIHLTESITLSVRQPNSPLGNSVSVVASNGRGKNDAKAVANILATRGITVTPAGAGRGGQPSPQRPALQQRVIPQSQPPPQPAPMAALNLNSAISIIPAAGSQSSRQPQIQNNRSGGTGGGNFAVPMGRSPTSRQQQREVERPPRPPTVDLTQDTPHRPPPAPQTRPVQQPYIARGRGRGRPSLNMGAATRHTCQLCNKAFSTAESLGQHMLLHRSPGKLPYSPGTQPAMAQRVRPQAQAWSTKWKCSNCPAQYPNQQGLMLHQQACRRNLQTMQQQPAQHQQQHQQPSGLPAGVELAVPVVDLKSPGTVNRLRALGINHYIPFSPFLNKPNGYIGLPIVAVDGNRLPISGNITQMGATAVVSFGPLRTLPRCLLVQPDPRILSARALSVGIFPKAELRVPAQVELIVC
uniref:C2H2-type domain-containing protein n=1 Tax=Timema poppense TaxID=170557 RepID=A0A7R9DIQ6_TIMPO|nr:unnamed protein product [Timema poppensis]